MSEQIFVLGCGPAGLLAAHAVAQAGHEPVILSKKEKSSIGGAQYLHSAIPGIAEPAWAVSCAFRKIGTRSGYAEKVYGDPEHPTSWEKYESGQHKVWNMRDAYERLWAEYQDQIEDVELGPRSVELLANKHMVISTIPKPLVCPDPEDYDWRQQDVWIYYGENVPGAEARDMEIIMSGDQSHRWYRQSNLFGWKGIEFSVEVPGAVKIRKPVSTTYPGVPGVVHLGRYGEWRKDVLVHDVYWNTLKTIKEM